jgi:hypothetical protein
MLISKYVEVTLCNRNFKKLQKNYNLTDVEIGSIVKIPIENLAKSSHYEVKASCDYCGKILKISYKRYNLNTKDVKKISCSLIDCSNQKIKDVCQKKWGVDNPFQVDTIKEKIKETLNEKYGVDHPMFLESTKDKIKETCLSRYGVEYYTKTPEYQEKTKQTNLLRYGVEHQSKTTEGQEKRKKTRIEKGNQIPDDLLPEYRKYRLAVNRVTNRLKPKILEQWNGFDYYDGEYIKDYFNLNPNDRIYPHFDHKISVIFGFNNNIEAEIIGSIDNICITKQWINGMKREKCEDEFVNDFKKFKNNSLD